MTCQWFENNIYKAGPQSTMATLDTLTSLGSPHTLPWQQCPPQSWSDGLPPAERGVNLSRDRSRKRSARKMLEQIQHEVVLFQHNAAFLQRKFYKCSIDHTKSIRIYLNWSPILSNEGLNLTKPIHCPECPHKNGTTTSPV